MNFSIRSLKKIDGALGPLLLRLEKSRRPKSRISGGLRQEINRILIIRPGGIGDAVLLIPSLKVVKRIMPYVQIDILCEPRNRGIFSGSPFVDKVFNYRDFKDLFHMRKIHYQIVIDTEQSHFLSAVLASKFRRSLKVGFVTNGRDGVYDIGIKYYQEQYEMNSFLRLFEGAINGWPNQPFWDPPYLYPSQEEKKKVSKLLLGIKRPVVCIFPGASIEERRWPTERWASVTEYLWSEGFHQPVLLGGENERELAFKIKAQADCPLMNFCGDLSLSETGALFERTKLLISTDSGILHLGVLSGVPTVSLFGPGIAKKWGPKGENHIVLNRELPCSPCTRFGETLPCPMGAQCMTAITLNDVIKATSELLSRC